MSSTVNPHPPTHIASSTQPIPALDYSVDISTQQTLETSILYIYTHTFCTADPTTLLSLSATTPTHTLLHIHTVQGGITNLLYKAHLDEQHAHLSSIGTEPVLIRIFGAKTEYVINRSNESKVVTHLHAAKYGAAIHCKFSNGRIEQFLNGTALEPIEMGHAHIQPLIARSLRRLHQFDLSAVLNSKAVSVFASIEQWIDYVRNNEFEDAEKKQVFATLNFDNVVTDYHEYKSKLLHQNTIAQPYSTGFCHNDLLSGNVMYDRDSDAVHVIDYEYSDYSYYAFDIANHFAEYSGFDCIWSQYPNEQQQRAFMDAYVKGSDLDAELLCKQVKQFALLPHYFWGIWAVVQAHISTVDFDYIHYSNRKLISGINQHRDWCFAGFVD